jgi:hypothetical protein
VRRTSLVLGLLLMCTNAHALSYTVEADGSGDFATIQAAFDAAAPGDSIELTGGDYTGAGNVDLTVVTANLTLWSAVEGATIDAGGTSRCLRVYADGFRAENVTLAGGQANSGGGILVDAGSPVFVDVIIKGCNANTGGGVYLASAGTSSFDNCTITGCDAIKGGGIYIEDSSGAPFFANCSIRSNSASSDGGGLHAEAVGPHFIDCEFSLNSAVNGGGDAKFGFDCTALFERCEFLEGQAELGGALHCAGNDMSRFEFCIFSRASGLGNSSRGGALYAVDNSTTSFLNCTFFRCGAYYGGGILCEAGAAPDLDNCIIAYGVKGGAFKHIGAPGIQIDCCDIYGNNGGDWTGDIASLLGVNGNISLDPQLADPWNGNFDIATASPCGPDYNPGCGGIGAGLALPVDPTYVLQADGNGMLPTIQVALNLAPENGNVLLAEGTYSGYGNRDLDFLGKGLHLGALDPASGIRPVIDAGGSAWENHRGIWLRGGEPDGTTISFLTIANGYSHSSSTLSYPGNGGGILVTDSSRVLLDGVRFEGNRANLAGISLYISGAGCDATLDQCVLDSDNGVFYSCALYASGCGLSLNDTDAMMDHSDVLRLEGLLSGVEIDSCDLGTDHGVAVAIIDTYASPITISNSTLRGGGEYHSLSIDNATQCTVSSCTLQSLTAFDFSITIGVSNAQVSFDQCDIYDVSLIHNVKAAQLENSQVSFTGCTIRDYVFASTQSAVVSNGGSLTIDDCLFSNNAGSVYHTGPGSLGLSLSNSIFQLQSGRSLKIENCDAAVVLSNNTFENGLNGCWFTNVTDGSVLDCDFAGLYSGRGLYLSGSTVDVRRSNFTGRGTSGGNGGAIYSLSSSVAVDSCSFNANTGQDGGAIACDGGSAIITNSSFVENIATTRGSAVHCNEADVQIHDCQFSRNRYAAAGGAVHSELSTVSISGSSFDDNQADQGGAIQAGGGSFYLQNSSITGNTADYAGAIIAFDCDLSILSTEIIDNEATTSDGAIFINQCVPVVIDQCLIARNTSADWGSALTAYICDPTISSCTIVGNGGGPGTDAQLYFIGACAPNLVTNIIAFGGVGPAVASNDPGSFTPTVNCCDIIGNAGGDWVGVIAGLDAVNDNFATEPLFCDMTGGDYHLNDISPCYSTNSPCGSLVGAFDLGCNYDPTAAGDEIPTALALLPNHPNPFNPRTEIRFELPEAAAVSLMIYDSAGRHVQTLLSDTPFEAGTHAVIWSGRNASGHELPSGIYFTRFEAAGERQSGKLTLIR